MTFRERLDLDLVVGGTAPPATGALVVAQDVDLILGDVGTIEDTQETPAQVLAEVSQARPCRQGMILTARRRGAPLLFQAIVYDFRQVPPTSESVVFEALLAAFEAARRRRLISLAVEPLGTAHGGIDPGRFLHLITQVCCTSAELGTTLVRVHLLLPSRDELLCYESLLRRLSGGKARN